MKPKQGQKLNLCAIITLLRVEPPAKMSVEEFKKRLRKSLARASDRNAEPDDTETAEFLSYDD